MTKTIASLLSIVSLSLLTVGCGSSSSSSAQETGWNGKFVDTGVKGIDWSCGDKSGKTLDGGLFGECPAGSSVTFMIGTVSLGTIVETSDHIFTPQDLVGASRTVSENTADQNAQINAIAAVLLTLDEDGDPTNGITIESTAVTAFETAVNANGGEITAGNVESITAATVSTVTTLTEVSPSAAETHLAETGIEIGNGTITPPLQPSDDSTN